MCEQKMIHESSASVVPKRGFKWSDLLELSQVYKIIRNRVAFLQFLGSVVKGQSFPPSFIQSNPSKSLLIKRFLLLFFDVLFGIVGVLFILGKNGQGCKMLSVRCLEFLQNGTLSLTGVLDWLMGNPVGLKLNKELANTLGTFFTHHVSLWQMYIHVLTSILEDCGYFLCMAGMVGLSAQMALVADIISLFTVHIHCFYIYMARLYNVHLRGLSGLTRFFRGKKWNPLRQRVDHITHSVDQLFVGSLLLTIFVFLLPTVITFYLVFAFLHILVKLLQLPFVLFSRWMEIFENHVPRATASASGAGAEAEASNLDMFSSSSQGNGLVDICRKFIVGDVF